MEIEMPPPLIDIRELQKGDKGSESHTFTMDKSCVSPVVLTKNLPDCNNRNHKNPYVMEQARHKSDPRGVDEQDCVGFAYDHGEYPIIVAVHSSVNQDSSSTIDNAQHLRNSQLSSYHHSEGNLESRFEGKVPCNSNGLLKSVDYDRSGHQNLSRLQKDINNHSVPFKGYPQPASLQNAGKQVSIGHQDGGQKDGLYFADRQFDTPRTPINSLENLRFQPTNHNGYFMNRFQASPMFGMHPAMLIPSMNDIRHAYLTNFDAGHLPQQAGRVGPLYGPSLPFCTKSILNSRISSNLAGHVDGTTLRYPVGPNYAIGSRKRAYDQIDLEKVSYDHIISSESTLLSAQSRYAFSGDARDRPSLAATGDTIDMMRYFEARQPQMRVPYFDRHTSCNDLVDAAVISAKRYAGDNSRRGNRKHEKECSAFESIVHSVTGGKIELKVPHEWMRAGFFQHMLRHENRYDLLQTLKVAASSSRELLLCVIYRLLSRRVNENASIILDNLKRSDLPAIVKEKVLSVIEEIIWRRPPKSDLWLQNTNRNKHSISNKKDTGIPLSAENDSHDHSDTVRKNINLLPRSEGIVHKEDSAGMSLERALVSESAKQNPEKKFLDYNLSDVNKSKQMEVKTLPSLGSLQSEVVSEVESCQTADFGEKSVDHLSFGKVTCNYKDNCENQGENLEKNPAINLATGSAKSPTMNPSADTVKDAVINPSISPSTPSKHQQNLDRKDSTDGEISHEKDAQDDRTNSQTRDQCTQVEDLQGFNEKEESFSDMEEQLTETNENSLNGDSLCNYYYIEELSGLENTDFELLGNVSVTVDSHGNTIIKKELAEGDNFEDGLPMQNLNILS